MIVLLWWSAHAVGPAEFIRFQRARFEDGLDVTVVEQPSAPVVTLAMVVDGGRADEPEPGVARVAAEAWPLTRVDPERTVADRYARMGAFTEVRVTLDHTVFITRVRPDRLDEALALEWLRLNGALHGVDAPPPSTPDPRAVRLGPVFQELFGEAHPYRDAWMDTGTEIPVYVASSWVRERWRPDRATLVVAGPVEADTLLCGIEPTACTVEEPRVVEAPLQLPEPTIRPPRIAVRAREVGPLQVGLGPGYLVAWALPGTTSIGRQLPRLVGSWIGGWLHARCAVELGMRASAVVCTLPPDVERASLQRRFRRGWPIRKLGKEVARWRERAAGALLGSTASADFAPRLAVHLREGGEPVPYAGALADLAFDHRAVERLFDGAAAYEGALWVELVE